MRAAIPTWLFIPIPIADTFAIFLSVLIVLTTDFGFEYFSDF